MAISRAILSDRPVLRRTLPPLFLFVVVVAATILSYITIAGIDPVEAAYWIISPDGVGFYFRDRTGPEHLIKAITVVSRSTLVLTGLWIGQTVVSAWFGGQITEELKSMQQQRAIDGFDNHVVVCGYGMFGRTVAQGLETTEHEIVVVEMDQDIVPVAERDGYIVVDGDARQESVLRQAGVDHAETIVAAVDDSNVNIQATIVARELAPDAELVVRVGDEQYSDVARRAGADSVVIPEVMSGDKIARELGTNPHPEN